MLKYNADIEQADMEQHTSTLFFIQILFLWAEAKFNIWLVTLVWTFSKFNCLTQGNKCVVSSKAWTCY